MRITLHQILFTVAFLIVSALLYILDLIPIYGFTGLIVLSLLIVLRKWLVRK